MMNNRPFRARRLSGPRFINLYEEGTLVQGMHKTFDRHSYALSARTSPWICDMGMTDIITETELLGVVGRSGRFGR